MYFLGIYNKESGDLSILSSSSNSRLNAQAEMIMAYTYPDDGLPDKYTPQLIEPCINDTLQKVELTETYCLDSPSASAIVVHSSARKQFFIVTFDANTTYAQLTKAFVDLLPTKALKDNLKYNLAHHAYSDGSLEAITKALTLMGYKTKIYKNELQEVI